jgi:hypothetical protein
VQIVHEARPKAVQRAEKARLGLGACLSYQCPYVHAEEGCESAGETDSGG